MVVKQPMTWQQLNVLLFWQRTLETYSYLETHSHIGEQYILIEERDCLAPIYDVSLFVYDWDTGVEIFEKLFRHKYLPYDDVLKELEFFDAMQLCRIIS